MKLAGDKELTETGQSLGSGQARILMIACGAIAREVLAVIEANGWTHIDLRCLPAILHNHPEKITGAVRQLVEKHSPKYQNTFVLYADCGTGGHLQAACAEMGFEMLAGPHCYSFFEGNDAFAARTEKEFTAFYLTDFLVRQFDAFVVRPLGLDRHPELRDAYFGNYEKLIYQAQTEDPALTAKAQECADFLGLAFEHHQTGYGDLASELTGWIAPIRAE